MKSGARPTATIERYWARPTDELFAQLRATARGLTSAEAERRLNESGQGDVRDRQRLSRTRVLVRQVGSPLLWLLIAAAAISAVSSEWSDAGIVLFIVVATVAVGYLREYRAGLALEALRARIQVRATVLRDGAFVSVPRQAVVPGDVIRLSAGSLVPADAVLLDATDCFVSEAALTGESFPVQKQPGPVGERAPQAERLNCVFLGTNVRSGTAEAVVVSTGHATELSRIAAKLVRAAPETDFDRGIRRFGYLLTSVMFVMVFVVFVAHTLAGRPPIETLLFSIALGVGLNPELLPAILSVNLARAASVMAGRGVLVRRLNAIENFGSMTVLCTDKTGTLTEGTIRLEGAYDPAGQLSAAVLGLAYANAALQSGLKNPLDDAIVEAHGTDEGTPEKLGEIPFDFVRKRLGVIASTASGARLITKGAFDNIISACTRSSDDTPLAGDHLADLTARYESWSRQGIRVLAIATRDIDVRATYSRDDEAGLTFAGFLTFIDRPKEGVNRALQDLQRLGVAVKMITGDNRLVAAHVAAMVGLDVGRVITGGELDQVDDAALWRLAPATAVFAEVDPNQKDRIIRALRHAGAVVGFLGDGINDAPAMHVADTSLSVDHAVDVARETADFVLLEPDLDVIRGGIEEGRRTFANTMKYILTTTSANLGNMLSMAAASLFLPFLPLLAGQILLNNLLSDVPAVGIADDAVDSELVSQPPRWDMRFIARFMVVFGLLSSVFDAVTFVVLLRVFGAGVELFRTGWFVESLLTELCVALVVRTRRSVFSSRPGGLLLWSSVVMMVIAPVIPYLPYAERLGFVHLPAGLLAALALIVALYVVATELAKRLFYRHGVAGTVALLPPVLNN
ncbi:MAG: magnesium-translocating P-type ATPase [Acidobacteriota bacterium]